MYCTSDNHNYMYHMCAKEFLNSSFNLIGIAGLVVWYLASGAQGPRIDTRLGHSRLSLDCFGFLTNSEFNW